PGGSSATRGRGDEPHTEAARQDPAPQRPVPAVAGPADQSPQTQPQRSDADPGGAAAVAGARARGGADRSAGRGPPAALPLGPRHPGAGPRADRRDAGPAGGPPWP